MHSTDNSSVPERGTDARDLVPSGAPRKRSYAWLGTAASLLLFVASMAVLYRILSEVKIEDIRDAYANATRSQLWLAAAFTVLSYSLLTIYDLLALRQLKVVVP